MNIDIEKFLEEKLDKIDLEDIAHDEIRKHVRTEIRSSINNIVDKEITAIIKKEIHIVMTEGPIQTNDGYGKKLEYQNFEELFKKQFYAKLESNLGMKRTIETAIKDHVSKLFMEHRENINKYIVEKITTKEGD